MASDCEYRIGIGVGMPQVERITLARAMLTMVMGMGTNGEMNEANARRGDARLGGSEAMLVGRGSVRRDEAGQAEPMG